MSAKVGLYGRPEAPGPIKVVADGVRALSLHPCFRNPHPFDRHQVEGFAWVVVFDTHKKSEEIARAYLDRDVPVILVVGSLDGTATVMSLCRKDGNRGAQEWTLAELKTGTPFRQCSNYPLPGLMPLAPQKPLPVEKPLGDEDLERMGLEQASKAAPLPVEKQPVRKPRVPKMKG